MTLERFDTTLKLPWDLLGFKLGLGLNALTGGIAANPFRTVTEPAKSSKIERSASKITAAEETITSLQKKRISSSGTVNVVLPVAAPITGVSIDAGIALEKSKGSSERTVVFRHRAEGLFEPEQLDLTKLQLRGSAETILQAKNYVKFRERYGDYFVAGVQRFYSFDVIMVCKASNTENMKDFKSRARTSLDKLFSAKTELDISKKSSEYDFVASVDFEQTGCDFELVQDLTTLGKLAAALEFTQKLKKAKTKPTGTPRIALLRHYSVVPSVDIENKLPVARTIFSDLHQAEELCVKIDNLAAQCSHPDFEAYRQTVADAQKHVTNFRRDRTHMGQDTVARETALRRLKRSKGELNDLLNRYSFLRKVVEWKKKNPFEDDQISMDRGTTYDRKEFGMTETRESSRQDPSSKSRRVTLENGTISGFQRVMDCTPARKKGIIEGLRGKREEEIGLAKKSHAEEGKSETIQFEKESFYIVGWVASVDSEETGYKYAEIKSGGILKENLNLDLVSYVDTTWHIRIVFVRKKYYDFPSLLQ
ncbi:hypothetical protein JR316_0002914 [Psilocybe cubensis]|uniref:MACPF domain-containing protein n=2 Tax=Psilocybe cubensis TaxID=181762 RepID=A0A8H8CN97_PSICU|nr:hypothetical protein JR316_0002914 [Psilocybe cubensis]KAH9483446.1 hypothetical protein JR316_0002914 [Psilocybe cubensis]